MSTRVGALRLTNALHGGNPGSHLHEISNWRKITTDEIRPNAFGEDALTLSEGYFFNNRFCSIFCARIGLSAWVEPTTVSGQECS